MRWLCIILYLNSICGFSQKILNVHYYSLFGKYKTYQFYNNQVLHYKLKGQFRYHANKVVNMQDSLILFDNDKTIKLNDIKALKVPGIKLNYILYNSALGFLESEVFYHFMFNTAKVVTEQGAMVTGIIMAAGVVASFIQDKHIYITAKSAIRITELDFQNIAK